jgi:ABC-type antimicrobial peptide transport system permease subunit
MKKYLTSFFLFASFLLSFTAFSAIPIQEGGNEPTGNDYEIILQEPLLPSEAGEDNTMISGKTGLELTSNYIRMIYKYGASILGIVCVLVIVVSGIQITMGGASDGLVSDAKNRIMQALLSLAILFLSAVILKTVNPGFFILGGA